MQNKSVQIPYELFFQLLQYFLMDNYDGEEIIRLGLEKKLDAMVNREVYSKSKTAPTEEEREKFRQEYLYFVKCFSQKSERKIPNLRNRIFPYISRKHFHMIVVQSVA